ncbi:hypothetical protein ACQCVP_19410 [Rossellomorea vietnamensis]|uniref:hypothetical protein n=1 Tax=Rossellomorea vietnamensis TaxID=218284 RepID=UPI003CF3FD3B
MHQYMSIMLSVSLVHSPLTEEPKVLSEHSDPQLVMVDKKTKELPEDKEHHNYKVQFKENGFYQVEHVFSENQYGSMKETRIYYVDGSDHYLVSRNEFSKQNILPESIETGSLSKMNEVPFLMEEEGTY